MSKNKFVYIIILLCFSILFVPTNSVIALENNHSSIVRLDNENDDAGTKKCQYVFGDPNDEESVSWMLQKFFNYVKIIGPLLVIILSGMDFAKNTLTGDAEGFKKATGKLKIRMICAIALFFIPLLTNFILNLINNSSVDSTCGIK